MSRKSKTSAMCFDHPQDSPQTHHTMKRDSNEPRTLTKKNQSKRQMTLFQNFPSRQTKARHARKQNLLTAFLILLTTFPCLECAFDWRCEQVILKGVKATTTSQPLPNLLNANNVEIQNGARESFNLGNRIMNKFFDLNDGTYLSLRPIHDSINIQVDPPVAARTFHISALQKAVNFYNVCGTIKFYDSSGAFFQWTDSQDSTSDCHELRGFFGCTNPSICSNIARIELTYVRTVACTSVGLLYRWKIAEIGLYKEQVLTWAQVTQTVPRGTTSASTDLEANFRNVPSNACPSEIQPSFGFGDSITGGQGQEISAGILQSHLDSFGSDQRLIHIMWNIPDYQIQSPINNASVKEDNMNTNCIAADQTTEQTVINSAISATASYVHTEFTQNLAPQTTCYTTWRLQWLHFFRIGFFVSQTAMETSCESVDLNGITLSLDQMLYTTSFQSEKQTIQWPLTGVPSTCGNLVLKIEQNSFLELVWVSEGGSDRYELRTKPGQNISDDQVHNLKLQVTYQDYVATPFIIGGVDLRVGLDCTANEITQGSIVPQRQTFTLAGGAVEIVAINEPTYDYFGNYCLGPQNFTPLVQIGDEQLYTASIVFENGVKSLRVESLTTTVQKTGSIKMQVELTNFPGLQPAIDPDWLGFTVEPQLVLAECQTVAYDGTSLGSLDPSYLVYTPNYSSTAQWTVPSTPYASQCGELVIEAEKTTMLNEQHLIVVSYDQGNATVSISPNFSATNSAYQTENLHLFVNYALNKAPSDLEIPFELKWGPDCDIHNAALTGVTWSVSPQIDQQATWSGNEQLHLINQYILPAQVVNHPFPWCSQFTFNLANTYSDQITIALSSTQPPAIDINYQETAEEPTDLLLSNIVLNVRLANYPQSVSQTIDLVSIALTIVISPPVECEQVQGPVEGQITLPSPVIILSDTIGTTYEFQATNPTQSTCGKYQISATHSLIQVVDLGSNRYRIEFISTAEYAGNTLEVYPSDLILKNQNFLDLAQRTEVQSFEFHLRPSCSIDDPSQVGNIQTQTEDINLNIFRTVADDNFIVQKYVPDPTNSTLQSICFQFVYEISPSSLVGNVDWAINLRENPENSNQLEVRLLKEADFSLDKTTVQLLIKLADKPDQSLVWHRINLRVVNQDCQQVTTGTQQIVLNNFIMPGTFQHYFTVNNRAQMEELCSSYAFSVENFLQEVQNFASFQTNSPITMTIDFESQEFQDLILQNEAWNTFYLVIAYGDIPFAQPLKLPFNVIDCSHLLLSGQESMTQSNFQTQVGAETPIVFSWTLLTTSAPSGCGGLDYAIQGSDAILDVSSLSQTSTDCFLTIGSIPYPPPTLTLIFPIKVFFTNDPTVSMIIPLNVTILEHPCKEVTITEPIQLSKLYATPTHTRKVYVDPWRPQFDSINSIPLANPKQSECGDYYFSFKSAFDAQNLMIGQISESDYTGVAIQLNPNITPDFYLLFPHLQQVTIKIGYDNQYHEISAEYVMEVQFGADCLLKTPTNVSLQTQGTVRIDQVISQQVLLPQKQQPWEYCDLLDIIVTLSNNRNGDLSINDSTQNSMARSIDLTNFTKNDIGIISVDVIFYIENFQSVSTQNINIEITILADPCAELPFDLQYPTQIPKMVYTPSYQLTLQNDLSLPLYSPPDIPPECPTQFSYSSSQNFIEIEQQITTNTLELSFYSLIGTRSKNDSTVIISVSYLGLEAETIPQTFIVQYYIGPDCSAISALPIEIAKITAIAETPGEYSGTFPNAQSSISDYPCQSFAYSLPQNPYAQAMLTLSEIIDLNTTEKVNKIEVSLDKIIPSPGIIPFVIETRLKHYPDVGEPILMPFEVEIIARANESPTFVNPLEIIQIQKDNSDKLSWSYQLPEAKDPDKDRFVYELESFEQNDDSKVLEWLKVDPESGLLSIEDLNDDLKVPVGQIELKVRLNDNRDPALFNLTLEIFPKPPIVTISQLAEETLEEQKSQEIGQERSGAEEVRDQETANVQSTNQAGVAQKSEDTETVSIGDISFDWTPPKKKIRNNKKELVPPRIVRFDISPVGLMTIEFSKQILIPDIFKKILDFYEQQEKQEKNGDNLSQRKLQEDDFDPQKILRGLFGLKLLAQSAQDGMTASDLITNIKLKEFKNQRMQIQLEFLEPEKMSPDVSSPDTLEVQFILPKIFVDSEDFQKLPETSSSIIIDIPPQLTSAQAAALTDLNDSVQSTTQALSLPQILLYTVAAQGLKFLWNVINVLQFLVFMQKWKIKVPYETMIWLKALRSITLFEFIPTKQILNTVSDFLGIQKGSQETEEDPLAIESGFSAMTKKGNILENMGMMLIIGVAMIFAVILLLVFRIFIYTDYRVYRAYQKIKQALFYNSFIRYVLQSALKLQIASLDSIMAVYLTSEIPSLSNLVKNPKLISPALILLVLWLSPFLFFAAMQRQESELQFVWVTRKIGTLYLGLNPARGSVKWHSFAFLIRRMTFVAITYSLMHVPGIQIQVFMFTSLIFMIFLNHQTYFEDILSLKLDNFNEFLLLFICYFFVLFCNLLESEESQLNVGTALLCTVILMIAVNGFFTARFIIQAKKHAKKMKKLTAYKLKQEEKFRLNQEAQKKREKVIVEVRKGEGWKQQTVVDILCPDEKKAIDPQSKFGDNDMLFCPESDHEDKQCSENLLIRDNSGYQKDRQKIQRQKKIIKEDKIFKEKNCENQNKRVNKLKEIDTIGRQVIVLETNQIPKIGQQIKQKTRNIDYMDNRQTKASQQLNSIRLQPSSQQGFRFKSRHQQEKLLKARGIDLFENDQQLLSAEKEQEEDKAQFINNQSVTKIPLIQDQECTNDSRFTFMIESNYTKKQRQDRGTRNYLE